jgi:shikimate dehydrogenase
MITASTRLVALVGHPVAHSLSPRMQNAAFAARGLDWTYVALDVPPERLAAAVRGLAAAGLAGANVTAPHKLAAAALCDEADAESVNTLMFEDGRIRGTSTDTEILRDLRPNRPAVIGAGGAGKAFSAALPGARVFARRGDWPPDVDDADLVVHATPVRDEVMVELREGQTLVDLVYPTSATADAARAAGATVLDGLDVLVRQGAASFELWTGVSAPLDVMRAAVRSTLGT